MSKTTQKDNKDGIFEDLFVLELANNHWGSIDRGLQIIREHGKVVKEHGIKAAVKFQFRDPETFVKKEYEIKNGIEKEGEVVQPPGSPSRYVKKTIATRLKKDDFRIMLDEVKKHGMLTMSTPFDEKVIPWCDDFDLDLVKISSHDASTRLLIDRIAGLGRPTIVSDGGTDISHIDYIVDLFGKKDIPLSINHCVSLYPSEDSDLELHQIDFLKKRYPNHVIGFSTHEYHDWSSSVMMAYAKGARTFERHVDIEDAQGTPVSKYCSLPHQVEEWFVAFKKAKEMCGTVADRQRTIPDREKEYVHSVSRGMYALVEISKGTALTREDLNNKFELAIPIQEGQASAHDLNKDVVVQSDIKPGDPIFLP